MRLALVILTVALLGLEACKFNSSDKKVLPIYGNRRPVSKKVDGKTVIDTLYKRFRNSIP